MRWRLAAAVPPVLAAALLAGCAGKKLELEVSGSVMYDKPRLDSIAHTLSDARADGGTVTVSIVMVGDAGLQATFDISPGIADHQPLKESGAGKYVGEFSFPRTTVGGPFTIFGRVAHEKAGEVVLRDPQPITITLLEHGG
jgi:hypothetical protein